MVRQLDPLRPVTAVVNKAAEEDNGTINLFNKKNRPRKDERNEEMNGLLQKSPNMHRQCTCRLDLTHGFLVPLVTPEGV